MDQVFALYARNAGVVSATVRRVLADITASQDADDVCQNVWLEATEHIRGGGTVDRAWLKLRAESRAKDHRQSESRRRETFSQFEQSTDDDDHNSEPVFRMVGNSLSDSLSEEVWLLIGELPEKQQEVVELHFRHGYSEDEIADHLGVTHQAVHNRIKRALRTVKERSKLSK